MTPAASTCLSGTDTWAVAYGFNLFSDYDIAVQLVQGSTLGSLVNLTNLEALAGSPALHEAQVHPDIDSDGHSFAVAYSETYAGSTYDYDVYAATLAVVGNDLALSEGHQPIALSTTPEDHPAITSVEGSGLAWRLELVVLDDATPGATAIDIEGGFYDNGLYTSFCLPNQAGVSGCPCANDPGYYGAGCNNSSGTGGARLQASGISSIGSDTLVLTSSGGTASALTIFNQGDAALGAGVPFGQGVRCAGGSLKRLFLKLASGGVATAPAAGDPSVHQRAWALGDGLTSGSTRLYYAYYRDPIVLGGCSSAATFNSTQTIQAIWID